MCNQDFASRKEHIQNVAYQSIKDEYTFFVLPNGKYLVIQLIVCVPDFTCIYVLTHFSARLKKNSEETCVLSYFCRM